MMATARVTEDAAGGIELPVKGPLRRCLATGKIAPKQDLLRFVADPEGQVVFDAAGRLPGRGLWLSVDRGALDLAMKRRLFSRAAKAQLRWSEDLPQQVEAQLRARCLNLLGLTRRSGGLTLGYEKVHGLLSKGAAVLLIQARDAAEGGRARLRALGRGVRPDLVVLECFTGEELASALGRDLVVHLAIAPGGLAERIVSEAARLSAYCDGGEAAEQDLKP